MNCSLNIFVPHKSSNDQIAFSKDKYKEDEINSRFKNGFSSTESWFYSNFSMVNWLIQSVSLIELKRNSRQCSNGFTNNYNHRIKHYITNVDALIQFSRKPP